jgi:hypothetical protein
MSYTAPESASKSERRSRFVCEFRRCTSLSRHTSEPTRAAALPLPNTTGLTADQVFSRQHVAASRDKAATAGAFHLEIVSGFRDLLAVGHERHVRGAWSAAATS